MRWCDNKVTCWEGNERVKGGVVWCSAVLRIKYYLMVFQDLLRV